MQNLMLAELIQIADDLVNRRAEALARPASGAVFRALLTRALADYDALPPALRGVPMADLLQEADAAHDGWLRALYAMRDLLRVMPGVTPAMLAAAEAIERDFANFERETSAPYAIEVQRAAEREPKAQALADTFKAVPTPDGRTLDAWVEAYLAAARELGALLSSRGDAMATAGGRNEARAMRGRLMGLLGDLRSSVRREIEAGTGLAADVEAALFAFADEAVRLADARRRDGGRGAAEPNEPGSPAEPVTET